jgi:hypothetical protein
MGRPDHLRGELEGGLDEQFGVQAKTFGLHQARQLYVLKVLTFIRLYFLL